MSKYFYNGVELPDINTVWTDKVTYPYASISNKLGVFTEYRYLYLYSTPLRATGNNATSTCPIPRPLQRWKLVDGSEEWVEDAPSGDETIYVSDNSFSLWANYNIYYVDDEQAAEILGFEAGSLFLAASDPVPVGGDPVLPDPLPVSPYLPINGAWVKHDIYKQVGNSWVKQPQGAVEVEGGAWSALS